MIVRYGENTVNFDHIVLMHRFHKSLELYGGGYSEYFRFEDEAECKRMHVFLGDMWAAEYAKGKKWPVVDLNGVIERSKNVVNNNRNNVNSPDCAWRGGSL